LNKKEEIQPYYIRDEGRRSTSMEIKTMNLIKKMLNEKDAERILNTIIINRKDIPKNDEITKDFETLASQSHLGHQYDWLARYTNSLGIKDLELSVHRDDTVEGFIKNDVALVEKGDDSYYKLVEKPSQPELGIFSYYDFPLLDMTKLDMEAQSKKSGFNHIMEMTWFCHAPMNKKPCGMCNPCKYTRDEGLGRRVPTPTLSMKLKRKIQFKLIGLKRKIKLN